MTPERAIIRAKQVARAIVPDLLGRELYVIRPRDGSAINRATMCGYAGLYHPFLLQALRPELEAAGEWRGDGVGVAVDAGRLFAKASCQEDAEREVIGTVLHELCHWAELPEITAEHFDNPGEAAELFGTASDEFVEYRATTPTLDEPNRCLPEREIAHHGATFNRLAAHCVYRSGRLGGFNIAPRFVTFGSAYPSLEFLRSPGEYLYLLWDECERLKAEPLRVVAAIEPPAEYAQAWREDQRKQYQPNR